MLMSLCTCTYFVLHTHTHKYTSHLHSTDCPVPAEDSREMTSLLKDRLVEGWSEKVGEERKKKKNEDKFIETSSSSSSHLNAGSYACSHSHFFSLLVSILSRTRLFSQSRLCCEIQYVSECLCALAVLYSNDLVDLPALICREAFSNPLRVTHRKRNAQWAMKKINKRNQEDRE